MTVYKEDAIWKSDGEQVIFGPFVVSLLKDGSLLVHCWPATSLAVSRYGDKDFRQLRIKRAKK